MAVKYQELCDEEGLRPLPLNPSRHELTEKKRRKPRSTRQRKVQRLKMKLGPDFVSRRPGPSGRMLQYISSGDCISLANEIFGPDGWEASILKEDITISMEGDKHACYVRMRRKVTVHWDEHRTTSHEDVGFGSKTGKTPGEAQETAYKEAATDSLKRCLRLFGDALGNCLYDPIFRSFVDQVRKEESGKKSTPYTKDMLLRKSHLAIEEREKNEVEPLKTEHVPQEVDGVDYSIDDLSDNFEF